MGFPTMWQFDKCRLRQATAASFLAEKLKMMFSQKLNTHRTLNTADNLSNAKPAVQQRHPGD